MKKFLVVVGIIIVLLNITTDSRLYIKYECKLNLADSYEIINKDVKKKEKKIIKNDLKITQYESTNNEYVNEEEKDTKVIIDIKEDKKVLETQKYGVVITKYITNKIYTYEDLSTQTLENSYNIINRENYNASVNELLEEAKYLVNSNKNINENILEMVNLLRKKLNLNTLKLNYDLCVVAQIRALELAYSNILEHTRPNGNKWHTLLDELKIKYDYAGENIGWYYKDEKEIMEAWANSKGHYQNMVNSNYNYLGVGYIKFNNETYYVQTFTN